MGGNQDGWKRAIIHDLLFYSSYISISYTVLFLRRYFFAKKSLTRKTISRTEREMRCYWDEFHEFHCPKLRHHLRHKMCEIYSNGSNFK